ENNHREWFHANKKRYETDVKKPFYAFVELMIDQLAALDRTILLTPKDCIFRINRDIRFSKDKTPYKTQMSAIISPGGRKALSGPPGLYLQFSVEDARIYSGLYQIEKKDLQNIREAIASQPKEFAKLIKAKKFVDTFGEIHGEKNKRLPKDLREAAEAQPLIYNKSFYYFASFPPDFILDPQLPQILVKHFKAAQPLNAFLRAAMA
ncbi:MAG: DUF2461 domain-containing protein, partial [Bacteroidota bacterium]